MNATTLDFLSRDIVKDAVFGLSVLTMILLFTSTVFIRVYISFTRSCAKPEVHTALHLTIRFIISIVVICVIQVLAILTWTLAIYFTGLITDLNSAMLFAGSCYTTLGIFTANLPKGWQSISFYIAFSGLFSFALATSIMISMITTMSKKIDKLPG
jgi:hypothetical protein